MILEKQTEGLILEEGVAESTSMVIDADSHIFLMRMLSKFYSDAVGSLIRETASNALNSHRQMNVTEPIIVSLKKVTGNYEFSVEDFGMGMDSDVIENVIKKYGKSTKRQSANQLGAFGLGFKSPLAYGPSFYFIGRKDGIERKWMMYEAEDEQNKIDLLYESPTKERNGVKVIVPVKHHDYNSFYIKIKEQLAYFEHVYFDVDGIDNAFTIFRHKDFQWSPLSNDTDMHICLDNVYYPIDWSKLGVGEINIPVGLRFGLTDGVYPLPNRETIKYTEEAKKAILSKITAVADYYVEKYNETVSDGDDVLAVFDHLSSGYHRLKGHDGHHWDVGFASAYSKIKFKKPKLKMLKKLDVSHLHIMRESLVSCYVKGYQYQNGRFKATDDRGYQRHLSLYNLTDEIYIYKEAISKVKKDYLRDLLGKKYVAFVRFQEFNLKNSGVSQKGSYYTILSLKQHKKEDWRTLIQDFQNVRSVLTKNFVDVDAMTIPQQWFDDRKKKKLAILAANGIKTRRKKLTGEVTGKAASNLERWVSGKNCKFEPKTVQMADAYKNKLFTIYGNQECEPKFQKWFTVLKKDAVRFMIFSERELKNLKNLDLHNWMTMEEFEKGKHIIYKRAVTAYLINNLIKANPYTFSKQSVIESISKDLHSKTVELVKYKNSYFINGDQALYDDMLKVAQEHNLFDPSIYPLYLEISKTLSKLPFLNPLLGVFPGGYTKPAPELIEALKNLFKYYKMRIDWIHYKVALNEETVIGEVKEEELEEII